VSLTLTLTLTVTGGAAGPHCLAQERETGLAVNYFHSQSICSPLATLPAEQS
jgi:hypothetical protein